MSGSQDIKSVVKWLGVAVLAAIPIYILLKKLSFQSDSEEFDESEIFAEDLGD